MNGKRQRRHFTGQEKMAILRRHLVDKVPVSQLREKHHIQPTLFYGWHKALFENGAAVFEGPRGRNGSPKGGEGAAAKPGTSRKTKIPSKATRLCAIYSPCS